MVKPVEYEIEKVLVLSTGHVTLEDSHRLDLKDRANVIVHDYEHGWYIWVGSDEPFSDQLLRARAEGYSAAFCNLMTLAHSLGCSYLKLDCDGPLREDLPKFDW